MLSTFLISARFTLLTTLLSALLPFTMSSIANAETSISHLTIGKSQIKIFFAPDVSEADLSVSHQQIVDWIETGSYAVDDYFDGFPVSRLDISINSSNRSKVNGTTYSGENPMIILQIGKRTSLKDLKNDWVLVHELVHLAFPPVREKHNWVAEGIATYIEPMVRVKAGLMSEENAWKWLLTGLPKGLPEDGDQGLDNTHTWGRTYWGGALYFFLADIKLREKTKNNFTLQDALIAIKRAGGTMQQRGTWPITKALIVGDKATDTTVLMDLYNELKNKAVMTNLDSIWNRLGVSMVNNRILYNDNAPNKILRKTLISQQ